MNVKAEGELEDVVPLSVADMEFVAPPAVRRALRDVVDRGVFGYRMPTSLISRHAATGMPAARDGLPSRIGSFPPRRMQALCAAIMVFVREGEGVIIQEPVYYPFRAGIEVHGRRVVNNPLVEGLDSDGRLAYSIDFEGLEAAASGEDVRMMLFCNPR